MAKKSKVIQIDTIAFSAFLAKNSSEKVSQYEEEKLRLFLYVKEKPVKLHKIVFGKQSFCFYGGRRYWVWKKSNWIVYVSDQIGVQFEVNPELSVEEAWEAWVEYKSAINNRK